MDTPASSSRDNPRERIAATMGPGGSVRCVFSSVERIKVGTGVTTRSHASKLLWFVEELGEGRFSMRKLNDHNVPSGEEKVVSLDRLVRGFVPEVEHYEQYTLPAMELLEDFLDEGEAQREEGRLYSAEGSFNKALGLDEQNVRALFNLGLVYMEMEDADKTRNLMRSLLTIRSAFTGKDQHLFNEFGISLRKHGLFNEAVEYYSRALDFAPGDDHLLFNLSRAHFERGDWEGCVDALARSRAINPALEPALELGALVVRMAADPDLCRRRGKPPVPDAVARAVEDLMVPPAVASVPMPDAAAAAVPPEPGRARSGPEPEPEPEYGFKPEPDSECEHDEGPEPLPEPDFMPEPEPVPTSDPVHTRPPRELSRGNGYTRKPGKKGC